MNRIALGIFLACFALSAYAKDYSGDPGIHHTKNNVPSELMQMSERVFPFEELEYYSANELWWGYCYTLRIKEIYRENMLHPAFQILLTNGDRVKRILNKNHGLNNREPNCDFMGK